MERRTFLKGAALGGCAVGAGLPASMIAGCSTGWIQTVEADLPELVNIVTAIAQVVAVAEGDAALSAVIGQTVQAAVAAASASLSALQDAVNAYKANRAQGTLNAVVAALVAAQADVQKVVAALPQGSVAPNVLTVIVGGLGAVVTILSSIQAIVPGAAPASVTASSAGALASTGKVAVPNAAAIRFGMNALLRLHGFSAQVIR